MAQVSYMDGVAVTKNSDGKYVATDRHYVDISQDGMAFVNMLDAFRYAFLKRHLVEAEKEVSKALYQISEMIEIENLRNELV